MKENILLSVFKNIYDNAPGDISIKKMVEKIKGSTVLKKLQDQYQALSSAKEKESFKKSKLPAVTISGTFKNGHAAKNLLKHSGLIQIDIDNLNGNGKMPLERARTLLREDKYTFMLFTSISGCGLKLVVQIEASKHSSNFNSLKTYYKAKYKIDIDHKCGDMGRLCFLSYDPNVFTNYHSALYEENNLPASQSRNQKKSLYDEINVQIETLVCEIEKRRIDITSGYNQWLNIGFALTDAVGEHGRSFFHRLSMFNPDYDSKSTDKQFTACLNGNRNGITKNSLFGIAKSYGIGISKNNLAGSYPTPIHPKPNLPTEIPLITRVENFLSEHFEFRRNSVNERLEFRKIRDSKSEWVPVNENEISRFLQKNHFKYSPSKTNELLNSEFVPLFNPIVDYFEKLTPWDATKEISYIDKLCSCVKAKDQQRFNEQFRKMLIRCVACSLVQTPTNPHFNKHVFVLVSSAQSTGKSTLCRYLCPPSLQEYYIENITFDKDGSIALAQAFLINLDELTSLSKYDNNHLKSFISKASINERLPYGKSRKFYPRRANFLGSTNNLEFLVDETGNVRWLPFEIESIDYGYPHPESEQYVDIDKLWAEAFTRLKNGEKFELTTQERLENEIANKNFQLISEEEELLMRHFEPAEKNKDHFLTNTEILQKLAEKSSNSIRLSSKKLGAVLQKLNFIRGTERIGTYPAKGYYIKGKV